jgi:hypothetical protein
LGKKVSTNLGAIQNKSLAAQAAWPLLVFTAVLQAGLGLPSVAYFSWGYWPASGLGAWTEVTLGGLRAVAAVVAFMLAVRHDRRGTTLAVAGSIMLG